MEPETKKRKFLRPPPRRLDCPSSLPEKSDPAAVSIKPNVNKAQNVVIDSRIQHVKNHVIAQAREDGSKANFRVFDSLFGNFLVPVVPTRAEFGG